MKNLIVILKNEFRHFYRSPFKTLSLILFMGAAIYGLQNGYTLYCTQNKEIEAINTVNKETISETISWFESGKNGPVDKPWINVSIPMRALMFTPTTVVKTPSPLMPFTIGQTEQFGYYKPVTIWSSTFDSDLAEEIANPERLSVGTLDFSFVVLYLLPVLVIVLLFNIGGLEKDLGFDRLLQVNNLSQKQWMFARFVFYFLVLFIVLLALMLPYALLTGTLQLQTGAFINLFLFIIAYMLLWFCGFYLINLYGKGSANQALKMVTVWLLFCIVLPGSVHQIVALKYPANYMMDFINAQRDETNAVWEMPSDSVQQKLLTLYPMLADTKQGKDTIINNNIMGSSKSGLVNALMKNTALAIEQEGDDKNKFIKSTYALNPVSFFQNKMNALAHNDYYAYKHFRSNIQSRIDTKICTLIFDTWNKETVNKEKYLQYVEELK